MEHPRHPAVVTSAAMVECSYQAHKGQAALRAAGIRVALRYVGAPLRRQPLGRDVRQSLVRTVVHTTRARR